jgi:hypothetical protein
MVVQAGYAFGHYRFHSEVLGHGTVRTHAVVPSIHVHRVGGHMFGAGKRLLYFRHRTRRLSYLSSKYLLMFNT